MTNKAAKDILGVDKESEFLQSFVRVGLKADGEDEEKQRTSIMTSSSPKKGDLSKQYSDGRSECSDGKTAKSKYCSCLLTLSFLFRPPTHAIRNAPFNHNIQLPLKAQPGQGANKAEAPQAEGILRGSVHGQGPGGGRQLRLLRHKAELEPEGETGPQRSAVAARGGRAGIFARDGHAGGEERECGERRPVYLQGKRRRD